MAKLAMAVFILLSLGCSRSATSELAGIMECTNHITKETFSFDMSQEFRVHYPGAVVHLVDLEGLHRTLKPDSEVVVCALDGRRL